jgi:hypothetical protein
MGFINISLLAGLGLAAVPIVLHLMMRRQPKHFEFPALRFIQSRQVSNTQRLQIRHWLLLAARCAVLALAALALARPSVSNASLGGWLIAGGWMIAAIFLAVLTLVAWSRDLGRLWILLPLLLMLGSLSLSTVYGVAAWSGGGVMLAQEEMPVAAAVIVDTAPHMHYRHENKTRLEVAQEQAEWIMGELPRESSVAVLDASPRTAAFAIDTAAAEKAVERLKITAAPLTLPDVLLKAKSLLAQSDKTRREIYVLTDLSVASWSLAQLSTWAEQWKDAEKIAVYVIDVGIEQPKNVALGELKLSAESFPKGAELAIETSVNTTHLTGQRTIDLLLDEQDATLPIVREGKMILPSSVKRGSLGVELKANEPALAHFTLHGLAPGVHHGAVRLLGEDGLEYDDVRYFSVEVEEPRPLLCIGGPNVNVRDFAEAIAPQALRDKQETRFACEVVSEAEIATVDWNKYRAVALLDPTPLDLEKWDRLANFVRNGGCLAIFLGPNAQPVDGLRDLAIRDLLGGRIGGALKAPVRAVQAYFAPTSLQHPVFAIFRGQESSLPWDRFPVHYYWQIDQLSSDSRVVASYSDARPALVETSLGRGRIFLFTTPGCEPLQPVGRVCWNELWAGEDAWPWFVLLNESFRYLVRQGEGRLNYFTGEAVLLQNDLERHPQKYLLFTPTGDVQDITASESGLSLRQNLTPGTYRLRGNREGPVGRGFSSNITLAATELNRVEPALLDGIFGAKKYQLVRNRAELNRAVGEQRVGQELYSYVLLLMIFILAMEYVVANRFYQTERATGSETNRWLDWLRSWQPRPSTLRN